MRNKLIGIMLPVMAANMALGMETGSLVNASAGGNKGQIVKLLNEGADINTPEKFVMEGPFYVCETKTIKDVTPVLAVLANNHVSLARWMIKEGADPKYITKDGGYQATHLSAFNGYSEPVIFLGLRYRMSLDQKDANGFDVYQAAQGGNLERKLDCIRNLYKFKKFSLPVQYDLLHVALTDTQKMNVQKYVNDDIGLIKALEKANSFAVKHCCENRHNPFIEINKGSSHPDTGSSAYSIAEKLEDDLHLGYFDYLKETGKFSSL